MGLDQYLSKRHYVKFWDHKEERGENYQITVQSPKGEITIQPKRITYIEEEVAYWRKANMIQNYFVEHCNDGDDNDGRAFDVSTEELQELLDRINKVLDASKLVHGQIANGYKYNEKDERVPIMVDGEYIEDPTTAKELLPTTEGFFFGSTDYDEYYHATLIETRDILTALIAEDPDGSYEYSASW